MADLGSIPPWLNVGPQNFASAAEAGQRLALQRAELAQRAQQAAAQMGMEQARLAAASQQAAQEEQTRREQIAATTQRAEAESATTKAYHDATLGLSKSQLDLATDKFLQGEQEKAAVLAERQGYAAAVAGGMKPAEAMSKFPRAWTPGFVTTAGAKGPEETISRHTTIPETQAVPAEAASKGFRIPFTNVPGWGAHPATPGSPYIPKQVLTETLKVPPGTDPAAAFAARQPGSAPAAGPAPSPAVGLPQAGAVVNGYTFKGGDPSDQKNWEPAE